MDKRNKHRYHTAQQGNALAAWLNSPESAHSMAAAYVRLTLAVMYRRNDFLAGNILQAARSTLAEYGVPASAVDVAITKRLMSSPISVTCRPQIRVEGQSVVFALVPETEDGRWFQTWSELFNSGNASRLKVCPNCGKYFYAALRADRKTCSQKCNGLLWQKTPKGRKARGKYLRDYRARIKKEWEEMTRGRCRKRGRNLHVSFKKGE